MRYATNIWCLENTETTDIENWLNGNINLIHLLDKYDAIDSGQSFQNFDKVIERIEEDNDYTKVIDDGKNYIYRYIDGSIIIVEKNVPTDDDLYEEFEEY